jgi:hypothetical protein
MQLMLFVGGHEHERHHRHDPHQRSRDALRRPRDAAVVRREEQPQHADRRDAEILEFRDDDARRESSISVCIALVKLHHAIASIIQPNAVRRARRGACARSRRPDRQSGRREQRGRLHDCWPEHERHYQPK